MLQVVTATETKADAERIAAALLEQRLAACVQIAGPVQSSYWWQGKIETAQEWLCIIKTHESVYAQVEEAIQGIHPYDTPEIIALQVVEANRTYLDWLSEVVLTGDRRASSEM